MPGLLGQLGRLGELVGVRQMTNHENTSRHPDDLTAFELTAADLSDDLAVEGLGDETALGTWGSASSWSSASCPASTASTTGSASSFG